MCCAAGSICQAVLYNTQINRCRTVGPFYFAFRLLTLYLFIGQVHFPGVFFHENAGEG
jgi:hypothetical protein